MIHLKRLFRYDELEIFKLRREAEEERQNAQALEQGMNELQESYEMQILSLSERIEDLEISVKTLLKENDRLEEQLSELEQNA